MKQKNELNLTLPYFSNTLIIHQAIIHRAMEPSTNRSIEQPIISWTLGCDVTGGLMYGAPAPCRFVNL